MVLNEHVVWLSSQKNATIVAFKMYEIKQFGFFISSFASGDSALSVMLVDVIAETLKNILFLNNDSLRSYSYNIYVNYKLFELRLSIEYSSYLSTISVAKFRYHGGNVYFRLCRSE